MRARVVLALVTLATVLLAVRPRLENNLIGVDLIIARRPPLLLGVIPYLTIDRLKQELDPVAQYLQYSLKRPVALNVASDYESLGQLLDGGDVHIAWMSHTSFKQLGEGKRWEPLCRPVQHGSVVYSGCIIARADRGIHRFADLRGRVFAYVDRYSGSGFYYPNRLFGRAGIDPLQFFSRVEFTHSHDQSIDGVLAGEFDAAAVYDLVGRRRYGEKLAQLRILAHTGPIPTDPMVVRQDMDPVLKAQISTAMLRMHEEPFGRRQLAKLEPLRGTSRFAGEIEVWKMIRQRLASGTSPWQRWLAAPGAVGPGRLAPLPTIDQLSGAASAARATGTAFSNRAGQGIAPAPGVAADPDLTPAFTGSSGSVASGHREATKVSSPTRPIR